MAAACRCERAGGENEGGCPHGCRFSRTGRLSCRAVSVIALVLLAAAVALLVAAELPRLSVRQVRPQRKPKARAKKRHLRVVEPEHDPDEFQRSVERDLANLPTYDPRAPATNEPAESARSVAVLGRIFATSSVFFVSW